MSAKKRPDSDDEDDYQPGDYDYDPYPDTVIEEPPAPTPSAPFDDPPKGDVNRAYAAAIFDPSAEILKPLLERAKELCAKANYEQCPVIHREGARCPVCLGTGFVLPEEVLR